MITTSAEFGEQIGSNARKLCARLLLDGETVEGEVKEVKVNKGACGESAFLVGNVYSSYITVTIDDCPTLLENQELELQIGVELTDGTVEYCTVGFYTASDVATSVGSTTFTGLGRLSSKCGGGYWSDNGWPQTVQSALDEIAEQTGVSIDASACDSTALALNIETSMDGLLHREALMYIAGLLGGFATESSDGGIIIQPFTSEVTAEMDADRTTEMFEFSDYDFTVTGVEVIVSESGTDDDGNEVEGVSYTHGTPNLTLSNPYMTQALFDIMAPQITGFTYRPGTVPIDMGDIRLEAGDVISAVDAEGVSHTVACLLLEHTFDGGLMTTITAPGESATEQEAGFTGSLSAAVQKTATELLVAKKVTATKLEALQASITELTAKVITTDYLTANYITANDIAALYVKADGLEAEVAAFGYLTASDAALAYATIESLDAATANITDLTVEVANINSLLAGNIGAGTVQTIHLSADNTVIDEALIETIYAANGIISDLVAGTIYTDSVQIANNEGQNLWIDGATIQISDGTYVRVQIGEDASGDYNLYLWNASGVLIWDALGLTEAGLTGNGAIIKDAAVADDAAISGYKLDISSVASCLNEDGSIVVDAANVTINESTLAAEYVTITTATNEAVAAAASAQSLADALASGTVTAVTQYYALGDSADEPPSAPSEGAERAPALVGEAIVGESLVEVTETSGTWTTTYTAPSDGEYLWTAFLVTYYDGTEEWTEPACLTDGVARTKTTTLETDLTVVQGQISAIVSETDIVTLQAAGTTIYDLYSALNLTVDGITAEVVDISTTVNGDGETLGLVSRVTTVEETAEGLSTWVSSAMTSTDSMSDYVESQINQLADSISLSVTDGVLGSTASITLSVNGTDLSGEVDLTGVREAFANDTSTIEISAGTVTFNAGTLLINAENFQMDADGNIVANNGTFSGTVYAYEGTIGPLTLANSANTDADTGHLYYPSAFLQAYGVTATAWDPYSSDEETIDATVDLEWGMKSPGASISGYILYLAWKDSGDEWTASNRIVPFGVTANGNMRVSGITIYPNIPINYTDDDGISLIDSENRCAYTDTGYLRMNMVKFNTQSVFSHITPSVENTYYIGSSTYYWSRVYCGTIYRSSEASLSDRKLKQNITALDDNYTAFLMGLKPVTYDFIDGDTHRKHMGFIAQDVRDVAYATVGDLAMVKAQVDGDDEAMYVPGKYTDDQVTWCLSYEEIIAPLVKVVQEQQHRIARLERQLKGVS